MKRVIRWPRWASVSVAVVAAVVLSAVCYPGGLAAAYHDFRDAGELREQLSAGEQTHRQLGADIARRRDRIEQKEELVTALIEGRTTLTAVVDQFADLNRADERVLDTQRARYGDLGEDELAACNVLDYVSSRVPLDDHGSSAVRTRLRAEYEQRYGHPAPGAECGR